MKKVIVKHLDQDLDRETRLKFSCAHQVPTAQEAIANYWSVAEVTAPTDDVDAALEFAFEKTNHIDRDWSENPEAKKYTPRPARSTSVGDIMLVDGKTYVVAPCGFTLVEGSPIHRADVKN